MADRDEILKSIRKGLEIAHFKHIELPDLTVKDIFTTPDKPLSDIFSEELTKINGECYYCLNQNELIEQLNGLQEREKLDLCYSPDKNLSGMIEKTKIVFTDKFENPEKIRSGISSCEYLIARFGSVMVSSALPGGRRIFSFPEIHIVIAYENQLVLEISEGLDGIMKKYEDDLPSQIINITGPSRTADIEKTLILGAHGPKKLIVYILKS
jgi:L-lactate dehydrogenase complex protein LldG